jgi:hypothetical protein
LVFALGAAVALGDTGDVIAYRSTIREAAGIYEYAPAVSRRGGSNWASLELRRMNDRAGGSRRRGLSGRFTETFRQDPFHRGGGSPTEPAGSGLGYGDDLQSSPGAAEGPEPFDAGLALATEVLTPDEFAELLGEVPDGTFELANFVVAYADGTRLLVLNLNSIVQGRLQIDWETLLQSIAILDGEEAALDKEPRPRAKKAAKEALEELASASERPSRSMIRITIGFAIGLGLWLLVRRL